MYFNNSRINAQSSVLRNKMFKQSLILICEFLNKTDKAIYYRPVCNNRLLLLFDYEKLAVLLALILY